MKVLQLWTWENPKPDEGRKKWHEYLRAQQYFRERIEKHNVKTSEWTKGTGKIYYLMEFESYDAYAKFSDDEGIQRHYAHVSRLVNNLDMNVLREVI